MRLLVRGVSGGLVNFLLPYGSFYIYTIYIIYTAQLHSFLLPYGSFLFLIKAVDPMLTSTTFLLPYGSFLRQLKRLLDKYYGMCKLSTPLWEFHRYLNRVPTWDDIKPYTFYSLMGVSGLGVFVVFLVIFFVPFYSLMGVSGEATVKIFERWFPSFYSLMGVSLMPIIIVFAIISVFIFLLPYGSF